MVEIINKEALTVEEVDDIYTYVGLIRDMLEISAYKLEDIQLTFNVKDNMLISVTAEIKNKRNMVTLFRDNSFMENAKTVTGWASGLFWWLQVIKEFEIIEIERMNLL